MRFARSVAHGIIGIVALVVLWGIWAVIIDEKASRHISDDDTAGMAIYQQIPFKGGK